MTTRAGFIGLLTGLTATFVLCLAADWTINPTPGGWVNLFGALILTIGGALAAHWSGSSNPWRRLALGGLSGGLAGTVVFCLLGAAAAAITVKTDGQTGLIIRQTELAFITCFLGGVAFGASGGWLARPRSHASTEFFDKSDPQMALNASITAVPATIVTSAAAAVVFTMSDFPLAVSLLLALISHLALTLVVPFEAQRVEHLCGMDEVKMAACVAIGAFPAWAVLLLLARPAVFTKPLVISALLISAGLSAKSLQTLLQMILPMRATFPIPQDERQKLQARLFGTIASSRGPRLVVLCIGCGLMMILPLHVVLISVLVNLSILLINPNSTHLGPGEITQKLFLTQAFVSSGLMIVSAAILSVTYLFYLTLGRWFSKRDPSSANNSPR